jgi:hypothetical protein
MKALKSVLLLIVVIVAIAWYNGRWRGVSSEVLPSNMSLQYNSSRDMYRICMIDDGAVLATFRRKRFYLKEVTNNGREIMVSFAEFPDWKR